MRKSIAAYLLFLLTTAALFTPPVWASPAHIPDGIWPHIEDPETGNRVYQLTDRPGNNMAFYYLCKNQGAVGDTPYLIYRNALGGPRDTERIAYFAINLATGEEKQLTPRGRAGFIADVQGEYMYCAAREKPEDKHYASINRYHLATGDEEPLFSLDPSHLHSANLTVNADGTQVLFIRSYGGVDIDLIRGDVRDGSMRVIAKRQRMSHIQFSPGDPSLFTFLNKNYGNDWRKIGVGWLDAATGRDMQCLLDPQDPALKAFNGHLTGGHPYWDAQGTLMIDFVDTRKPYAEEYCVRVTPNREHPGEVRDWQRVRIEMGEFQCHFNPGPSPEWYVGDGKSADWWHKPGFGEPFIHKLHYDWAREELTQIRLAGNVGTYWTSGELEPNARYVPGLNAVVWNAFRTLEGASATLPEGAEESWLYGPENNIKQNVFAVSFGACDKPPAKH